MIQKYFFICNYLLIILVGIVYFNKIKQSLPLRLFLIFLGYSLITEILGTYFGFFAKINNAVIYNTWNLINYLFYSFFFFLIIKNRFKRRIITLLAVLFFGFALVNTLFFQNFLNEVFINNAILGHLLLAVIVILYFTELLNSDQIMRLQKSMFFWISLGVLLYSLVFLPVFIIGEFISYKGIYRYVTFGLNIVMAGCFITGFIVSKKEFNN
jgi:hypothetical protein